MSLLKLFGDRISHATRAPVLLLRTAGIKHEEVEVKLFKGENRKKPELPFKKVPVLTHGDFTVAESTSILRYIGQLEGGEAWYGARSIQEKAKVDEFLDYWQSTLHPNVIRLTQNKLLFKMVFRRSEPDQKIVNESLKAHNEHKEALQKYFIGSNQFIGGNQPSIADLLMCTTLQQTALSGADHGQLQDYIQKVRASTDVGVYDELESFIMALPQNLKAMKML